MRKRIEPVGIPRIHAGEDVKAATADVRLALSF
jgi:hypothetical protein